MIQQLHNVEQSKVLRRQSSRGSDLFPRSITDSNTLRGTRIV